MADRPILFSAPMVRALLEGRKTQTRRVIDADNADLASTPSERPALAMSLVRFAPGDRLWVREAWGLNHYKYIRPAPIPKTRPTDLNDTEMVYFATEDDCEINNEMPRTPSIHMPRWASRLTLSVTYVRVERLQDISEADAIAEGVEQVGRHIGEPLWKNYSTGPTAAFVCPVKSYRCLWNSINGPNAWEANPWCCAVSFKVIKQNIDEVGK